MIDLQKISGLPIELLDDGKIRFDPPLAATQKRWIRDRDEVANVLMDQSLKFEQTYWGYRQICLPQHKEIVARAHLQYDITVLPPLMYGEEFIKTVGHYHGVIPGSKLAHPELYEILHGKVLILLQKMDEKLEKVLDIITIEAKAGDRIVYPPNYGHILINIGSDFLVTANWLSTDYKPLYEPVRDKRGMAYYAVKSGSGYKLVANPAYGEVPKAKIQKPERSKMPMYTEGMANPKILEFLNHPEIMYN